MTKDLKQLALLTTWKELLMKTKDYTPFKVRTIKTYKNSIKTLKWAIKHFREHKPPGEQSQGWDHGFFLSMQKEYWIPHFPESLSHLLAFSKHELRVLKHQR